MNNIIENGGQNKNMKGSGMKAVMAWTIGIAVIALVLLIMLILFGNLSGNVGFAQTSTGFVDQTITLSATGETPPGAQDRINGALSNVVIINATNGSFPLNTANYTITGVVINTTDALSEYTDMEVNVTYTVTYDEEGKISTDNLIGNYSEGAVNTSTQFPVVGTIIGVALLLLILIGVLIFAITKLGAVSNIGGSDSFGGSSNSRFGGSSSSSIA